MTEIKVNEGAALEAFQRITHAATGLASNEATFEKATTLNVLEKLNHLENTYQAKIKLYIESLTKSEQESQQLIKKYGEIDRTLANQ